MLTSHVELEDHGDIVVVVMIGEHDLSNAEALRTVLAGARHPSRSVVVDLSGSAFIDSAVLAVLVAEHSRAISEGVGFALAVTESAGHGVPRILSLSGLDVAMPVAKGREQAIAAARSGRRQR